MLSFEDEGKLNSIPGPSIQPRKGFVPAAGGAVDADARFAAGNEFRRISVEDKSIINSKADVNQLVPFKYKWACEKYIAACANHWTPQEANMSRDSPAWT